MQFSKSLKRVLAGLFVATFICVPLTGCAGTQANTSADKELQAKLDPVEANKQYMENVNGKASELAKELSSFSEYVANSDAVNVKLVVDKVGGILDSIKDIEAPDQMKDIHSSYSEAADDLKTALTSYVEVFVNNAASKDGKVLSADDEAKLKDASDKYKSAVDAFNKADESAKNNESLFSKNYNNAKK